VLNEHNTVFAQSGQLYATGVSMGPPLVDANGTSIASTAFAGDRPTDRLTIG